MQRSYFDTNGRTDQPWYIKCNFIAKGEVCTKLYASPNAYTSPPNSDAQGLVVMHGGRLRIPRLYPNHSSNLGKIKPSFFRASSPFARDQFKNDRSQLHLQRQGCTCFPLLSDLSWCQTKKANKLT